MPDYGYSILTQNRRSCVLVQPALENSQVPGPQDIQVAQTGLSSIGKQANAFRNGYIRGLDIPVRKGSETLR